MPSNDPKPEGLTGVLSKAWDDIAEVLDPNPYFPQVKHMNDIARAIHDKAIYRQVSPSALRRLALVAALLAEDTINGGA